MTTVEFLLEKYKSQNTLLFAEDWKQAKEMEKQEKQEKIDFADKYGTYLLQGGIMSAAAYNETFKSE